MLKRIFGFVFFIVLTCHVNASIVNDTYNSLTLKQKVALLFIDNNGHKKYASGFSPGICLIKSVDELKTIGLENSALVFMDVTKGLDDGLEIPFPSSNVIRTSSHTAVVSDIYDQLFQIYPRLDGLITGLPGSEEPVDIPDEFQKAGLLRPIQAGDQVKNEWVAIRLPRHFITEDSYQGLSYIKALTNQSSPSLYNRGIVTDLQVNPGLSLEAFLEYPYLILTDNFESDLNQLTALIENQLKDYYLLERKVKYILELQTRIHKESDRSVTSNLKMDVFSRRMVFESSIVAVSNQSSCLPLKDLYDKQLFVLDQRSLKTDKLSEFLSFHTRKVQWVTRISDLETLIKESFLPCVIVLSDNKDDLPELALHSWHFKELNKKTEIVLLLNDCDLNKGIVTNDYSCFNAVLIGYQSVPIVWESAMQAVLGGIEVDARLISPLKGFSLSHLTIHKNRLKLGIPEEVGMSSDVLKKMDGLFDEIIQTSSAPGGQVVIAKDGVVVYRKVFGSKTYRGDKVQPSDLYDIASLTKIMATTPLLMDLFEKEQIRLDDSIKSILAETSVSNKGHIRIDELLIHKSGLSSSVPVFYDVVDKSLLMGPLFSRTYSKNYPYKVDNRLFVNAACRLRKDVFSGIEDTLFSIEVAKGMYMNYHFLDSIYQRILDSKVDPFKHYRYSDMGLYLLQKIIERKSGRKTLDVLVDSLVFKPMGMNYITYCPLKKVSPASIVPTEEDRLFRKQLLNGYVHDPGAAMMGGVAGHAGLFSNADDLCKMMQMYLNGGVYGGIRLFAPSTVSLFTSAYKDNRRGLGFDKPEIDSLKVSPVYDKASSSSFGHLGFTGTIAWADPKNKLVFIFLTNRVHPNAYNKKLSELNFRVKAMQIAYQSIYQQGRVNSNQ